MSKFVIKIVKLTPRLELNKHIKILFFILFKDMMESYWEQQHQEWQKTQVMYLLWPYHTHHTESMAWLLRSSPWNQLLSLWQRKQACLAFCWLRTIFGLQIIFTHSFSQFPMIFFSEIERNRPPLRSDESWHTITVVWVQCFSNRCPWEKVLPDDSGQGKYILVIILRVISVLMSRIVF